MRRKYLVGERPRYRRISTCVWSDEKFRQLTGPKPNAQSLWLFLLCGPQTRQVPGLFSIGEAALAENLGWSLQGFRRTWKELANFSMVQADWRVRLVWIPKAVKHNPPESPNVVRGWRSAIDEMPECALKAEALAILANFCTTSGKGFREAFAEAFPEAFPEGTHPNGVHPSGNQDQEQDQEQDQDHSANKASTDAALQSERFDRFWTRYPRQTGRLGAQHAWLDIDPTEQHAAEILAGVERYRLTTTVQQAIATNDFQFVMSPKNWLRDAHWEDAGTPNAIQAPPTRCRHGHAPPCVDDASCTKRYLDDLHACETTEGVAS